MSKILDAVLGLSLFRVECFRILEKACIAFSFKCSSARVKLPVGVKRVPKYVYSWTISIDSVPMLKLMSMDFLGRF